jgi:hypothetical protein
VRRGQNGDQEKDAAGELQPVAEADALHHLAAHPSRLHGAAEHRAADMTDPAEGRLDHRVDRVERVEAAEDDRLLPERHQHAPDPGDGRRDHERVQLGAHHAHAERRRGPLVAADGHHAATGR